MYQTFTDQRFEGLNTFLLTLSDISLIRPKQRTLILMQLYSSLHHNWMISFMLRSLSCQSVCCVFLCMNEHVCLNQHVFRFLLTLNIYNSPYMRMFFTFLLLSSPSLFFVYMYSHTLICLLLFVILLEYSLTAHGLKLTAQGVGGVSAQNGNEAGNAVEVWSEISPPPSE